MLVLPTGIRSAASLWSGARLWTAHFRSDLRRRTVVSCWPHAELGIQLLIAVLWDGLDLVLCRSDEELRQLAAEYEASAWVIRTDAAVLRGAGVLHAHESGWPAETPAHSVASAPDATARASTLIAGATRRWSAGWVEPLRMRLGAPRAETMRLTPLPPSVATDADDIVRAYLLPLFAADEVWSADTATV